MQVGKRIIYASETGRVLNDQLNEIDTSDNITGLRPDTIDFVDLEFGSTILDNASSYHINTATKEIVIDSYIGS